MFAHSQSLLPMQVSSHNVPKSGTKVSTPRFGWRDAFPTSSERRRGSLCWHNMEYRRLQRQRADSSTKLFINNFPPRSLLSLFIPLIPQLFSRKVVSNACATIAYVYSHQYDSLFAFRLWPILKETGVSTTEAGAPRA